jgi:6-phosphogluconolactonase
VTVAIEIFPDPAAVQAAAAEVFAARTAAAARARGAAFVALAGGSTPRGLYGLLADPGQPFRARVPWPALHVFWGDERPVPPDHPDSNYRMAHEALLREVAVPAAQVHRIPAEDPDPRRAAQRYAGELRRAFGAHGRLEDGWPRFDLVLLGMGADGHTASLFPGTDVLHERAAPVAATWVPALGTHRITLTAPVLNRAEAVAFLVTGADKAETLAAVLDGPPRPDAYPSQGIRPDGGTLLWLVDRAAASRFAPRRGGAGPRP